MPFEPLKWCTFCESGHYTFKNERTVLLCSVAKRPAGLEASTTYTSDWYQTNLKLPNSRKQQVPKQAVLKSGSSYYDAHLFVLNTPKCHSVLKANHAWVRALQCLMVLCVEPQFGGCENSSLLGFLLPIWPNFHFVEIWPWWRHPTAGPIAAANRETHVLWNQSVQKWKGPLLLF